MRAFVTLALAAVLSFAATPALSADGKDSPPAATKQMATFAGGCFWCMEPPFKKLPGVVSVTSGYTGGHVPNPTYHQVSAGDTGHAEAIDVIYDPTKISYEMLLDVYWHNVDPTTPKRQFCDSGDQYRTAIFYHDDKQKQLAEASRDALQKSGVLKGASIVTEITPASTFYAAEEFHQAYYRKEEVRYQIYRRGCGRDQRLQELYGDKAGGGH